MVRFLLLFAFLSATLSHRSFSQATTNYFTLSGVVRDSATGQPLVKAAIVIDYDRYRTGTTTDAQGRFDIALNPGPHVLVVRYVGYVPFRTPVSMTRDVRVSVNLNTVSSQLEEVVVTSKGFDRTIRQPLLGVSQISIATLKKLPSALGEVDIMR
ncbi:MAG: carboxypeptidase-like regulatory domain-containing protein, partial [Sphingobacteriaceae bacterium]|nr:carboxypeptidase-like regulatory domain-containing protein [Cytophagaceae bacterium]